MAVHGNWTKIQQKADLYARVQIKKLSKQLEAVKRENEEYAKQARFFVTGIHDDNHPQKGNNLEFLIVRYSMGVLRVAILLICMSFLFSRNTSTEKHQL